MRYALLICTDEVAYEAFSPEEAAASTAAYEVFMAGLGSKLLGGERLRPTTEATCVRVQDGRTITTDGPFAETKEQLGGFFLVDAADLDEAIEIAAQIPTARGGTIEVRPIWEM